MNSFLAWFHRNGDQIGWFIIGWMSLQGINDIIHGDLVNALLSWFLVAVNYLSVRK